MSSELKVLFDDEAFVRHRRSGITRYFAELIGEFRRDRSLAVSPITPYHYVANAHLKEAAPDTVRVVPLPARWRAGVLGRLNARRRARADGADLVHHSIYELEALDAWPAPVRVGTVYDFTVELFPEVFGGEAVLAETLAVKKQFLEACDLLLCISETTKQDLARFHPDLRRPVAVTPLAASPTFSTPRPARIAGLPERYLLHVGNRHAHKNVGLLFRAFQQLQHDAADLHLVLCGQGLPEEDARLKELGIKDRTVHVRVDDGQLPWLYHRASAFVFPSQYEGFGLPVVEAMSAGCPVIVSDTPALVEVAEDAALHVGTDDVEGLVELCRRVLRDPAEADRLRAAGRSRAAHYSWRRTAGLTAAAYHSVA